MNRFVFGLLLVLFAATSSFAGVVITALPNASTLTGIELFPLVQGSVTKGASINSIWNYILTKGGSGSNFDADLLDGQHGSYYQPAATAITTSNIGSQTVNYANGATTASSATNANNANNLNNQPPSYYQPAATAITTSNIGSQSVNYANSAGDSSTLNSKHWVTVKSGVITVGASVVDMTTQLRPGGAHHHYSLSVYSDAGYVEMSGDSGVSGNAYAYIRRGYNSAIPDALVITNRTSTALNFYYEVWSWE